jgi:hypothetical protein
VGIVNKAMYGSSHLYAELLNDFSSIGINSDVAEFLKDNIEHIDTDDITNILENPDWIIRQASDCFLDALANVLNPNDDAVPNWRKYRDDADSVIKHVKSYFDAWGNYYVFVNPRSNACADYYIIRTDSESSAYSELLNRFENDFKIDDEDITEDTETNDNDTAINTDNLRLIGAFKFEKE